MVLVICGSDDIRPIIYVPYVYLVKLIYFIFFFCDATDYGEIKMNNNDIGSNSSSSCCQ